ncbi:MAG TPA: J domain-containing protein [Bryobacteraceae bacterium]|jgi:hypothetical protein
MNYYEELGLDPSASNEEIGRAHRTLSRLFHPDLQTDAGLREAAERQMRRLNEAVEILLDPGRRRIYDRSQQIQHSTELILRPAAEAGYWRSDGLRQRMVTFSVTIAAGVLFTLVLVWWFAGDSIHFQGSEQPEAPKRSVSVEPAKRPAVTAASEVIVASPPVVEEKRSEPEKVGRLPASFAPHGPVGRSGGGTTQARPQMTVPDPAPATAPPQPELPSVEKIAPASKVDPQPRGAETLEGVWVYSAAVLAHMKEPIPLYAPVFIQLEIRAANSHELRGEYNSRYRVPDRPISAEVAFEFSGSADQAANLKWRSADGSRGIVKLCLKQPRLLEVDWQVTEFGSRIGLGAGTALLVRRQTE